MIERKKVLAVGASGPYAGLVVPELARRGVTVRGLIRDSAEADRVRHSGAAEIAIGDLRDRKSLDAALKGVDSVFYLAPAFIQGEIEIGQGMVDAAKQAGVRRFIFSSVIHPILSALVNHGAKAAVEESILTSDMEYTFLHPALFFQNLERSWPTVVETSIFAEPWSTVTRFTRVDYRDVAEVAAIALTEDRLLFGTFELCAEGNLDREDVAALMGEVLRKKIGAAMLSPEETAESPGDTGDENRDSPIQRMFAWYGDHGLLGNPLILHAILGREPRTLRAYIKELAANPAHPSAR